MDAAPRQKLIFSGSIEALLKVINLPGVSPAALQQLAALRFKRGMKVEPAYPAEDWAKAVRILGADLFPQLPEYEQHREIGRAAVRSFTDTLMGKAMIAAARVLGSRRSLERLTHNLRTGANFIETRFTTIDATTQELWINDVCGVPGFYAGMIGMGAEVLPGCADTITLKELEGLGCHYTLSLRSTPT